MTGSSSVANPTVLGEKVRNAAFSPVWPSNCEISAIAAMPSHALVSLAEGGGWRAAAASRTSASAAQAYVRATIAASGAAARARAARRRCAR